MIRVQTFDDALAGTTVIYKARVYYDSSKKREYPFSVTYVANSRPYFNDASLPTQVISCGVDTSLTVSTFTDDDGDASEFKLTTPTIPFTATLPDNSTNVVSLTGLTCASTKGTYNGFVLTIANANSLMKYNNSLAFDVQINEPPMVSLV